MPGWPSTAQRRELGSFPGYAGPEDVERFFELSPEDLRWVLAHRGDARLGVAVQLCSLRWLGFVPDLLAELPRPALLALSEQVESDPDDLMVYGARSQTRTDHFQAVRDRAGFRAFDQVERQVLEEWLGLRAIEHERPKALWELCCEHLLAERIVRPLVDTLVRMIGAARERAHITTHQLLSPQLKGGRPRELDRLLELREPGGVTWLEWLRTRRMAARQRRSAVRSRSTCTWIGSGRVRSICRCWRPVGCGCSVWRASAGRRGRSPGWRRSAVSRCCWCSSRRCSSSVAMS
jgi:hypothetical protein